MKQFYSFFLVMLVACSPKLVYVGNYSGASDKVDIYLDESAIPKDYEVIGIGTPDLNYTFAGQNYDEIIAKKAILKARACGADAVLFSNYYRKPAPEKIKRMSSTVYTDSNINTRSLVSRIPSSYSTGRQILFLKYK
ncbi:MAG: hypothetical protein ABI688_06075 [Bacteroidota bacterium]